MSRQSFRTALVSSVLLALAAACGQPPVAKGVARLVVRPVLSDPAIARMTATVSAGIGNDPFSPILVELTRGDGQWTARITGIPVGGQRQFDVVAFDANGNGIYQALARADVTAPGATVVSISLDNRAPNYQNVFPAIDSLSWSPDTPAPGSVVQLRVTAHDPVSGDTLSYLWTAECGLFDDPRSSSPKWTAPATPQTCHLSVSVSNNRGATVGYDFAIHVVSTVGDAGVTVTVNSWPVISSLSGVLTVRNGTMDGDLAVVASDPDGNPLSYTWESTCSSIVFKLASPYSVTAPHITLPLASTPCTIIISVFDGVAPRPTTGTLYLSPEVVRLNCQNVVCPAGQACDLNDGLCKGCTASCAGRMCGSDGCGGSCGACPGGQACSAAYQCIPACTPSCSGKVCGPDGCGGVCGTCGAGLACTATGQCVSSCTPACSGRTCGPDGCGGSCGTCGAGLACAATGQCVSSCTPACSGKVCGPDGCGGSCGTCASGTCSSGGLCVAPAGGVVTPFVARDLAVQPVGTIAMDASGNTLVAASITNTVATNFQTDPAKPGILLASQGANDAFLAKYDAAGNIVFGETIGDDDPTAYTDQYAFGAGFTSNGKVAYFGKITGTVTMGTSVVAGAGAVPYLAAISAVDGTRLWGKGFDLGSNGAFTAIATNPPSPLNRIAVCGSASKAGVQLVPGTTFGGALDLVVAVFDTDGNKLWALQVGGAGTENCSSVALDDNGDVFAAGQFDGSTLAFCPTGSSTNGVACSGAPIVLAGPGTTARKFIWTAKFAGATGNTLAAAAYSGAGGVASPQALAVGAGGDVFLTGSFQGLLTIGAALPNRGGTDAFLARLSGSTLTPVWNAIAWGGDGSDVATSVATTAAGDVLVTGYGSPSSPAFRTANGFDLIGAVSLNVAGTSSPDIVVASFNGQTGALEGAATYGDAQSQRGLSIAANRFSSPSQVTFSTSVAGSATFGSAGTVTVPLGTTDIGLVFSHLQ